MVVVIREFVKEWAWLQDEGGQHHPWQVHARPQLLQQDPHQALVLLRDSFCLRWFTCLWREKVSSGKKQENHFLQVHLPGGSKLTQAYLALAEGWMLSYTTTKRHQLCLRRSESPKHWSEWYRKLWASARAGTRQGAHLCCVASWATASTHLRTVMGQPGPTLTKGNQHCSPSEGVDMPKAVTASLRPGGMHTRSSSQSHSQQMRDCKITIICVEKFRR